MKVLFYTKKKLKNFYMNKILSSSVVMVVRSLNVNKDPLHPCEGDEELLDPEVSYLNVIGALIYLANSVP